MGPATLYTILGKFEAEQYIQETAVEGRKRTYAITEKGLHNGAICESSLPYSVRLRADKNITIFNQKLKRRAQIQSDIAPRRNGTYTVTLAFNDDESQPILKMELMVPKEVMAKDLAERFQKNPEQLYTGVLNTLFSEPDEGK